MASFIRPFSPGGGWPEGSVVAMLRFRWRWPSSLFLAWCWRRRSARCGPGLCLSPPWRVAGWCWPGCPGWRLRPGSFSLAFIVPRLAGLPARSYHMLQVTYNNRLLFPCPSGCARRTVKAIFATVRSPWGQVVRVQVEAVRTIGHRAKRLQGGRCQRVAAMPAVLGPGRGTASVGRNLCPGGGAMITSPGPSRRSRTPLAGRSRQVAESN